MKILVIDSLHGMEALEAYVSVAAVEAFSLRNVANRAIDVIPNLAFALKEVFASTKTDKYDLKPLQVNFTVLDRALKSADYMSVGILNIYTPQGFKGNMLEYTHVFKQAQLFTDGVVERLVKFNQLVSSLISDSNTRRSTKDLAIATADMELQRQGIRDQLAKFDNNGSRIDRAKLSSVYASLNEVKESALQVADILVGANHVSVKEVEQLTNDASELLKALGEQAMAGQIPDMSNEAYRSLSSSVLTMARDVELFSLITYATYQLKKATEDTANSVITALRYK